MQPGALGDAQAVQIDLHRLELRFANARITDGAAVRRLANSIDQDGQLVACIAAGQPEAGALVLIDGYRRVAALSRLGRDTALVQCWSCPLEQALAQMLARSMSRVFTPLEEALLLRELIDTHGLSQRQAARLCARDVSWVQRRLMLLGQLPEPLVQAVRTSRVSTWAAARIFVPLARANAAHASCLLASLQANQLSTRQLHVWFEHYQGAQRSQRERMVQHPSLFIQSLNERNRERQAQRLRDGPERELKDQLGQLQWLLGRVRQRLEQIDALSAPPIAMACRRVHAALPGLNNELRRLCHDPDGDTRQHTGPAAGRHEPARDQQAAQALA